eukprot:4522714-Pyramimonas_sp.AAC.1
MAMQLMRELLAPLDRRADWLAHLSYEAAFWLQSVMLLVDDLAFLVELVGRAHRAGLVDLAQVRSLSCETHQTLTKLATVLRDLLLVEVSPAEVPESVPLSVCCRARARA